MDLVNITDEQIEAIIAESRQILKGYRTLKGRATRMFPSLQSPSFSDMPRSSSAPNDSKLDKYVDLKMELDHIEKAVASCDLTSSIILQNKYIRQEQLPQSQLAQLSGYSVSRYNDYLRQAHLQFSEAYRKGMLWIDKEIV